MDQWSRKGMAMIIEEAMNLHQTQKTNYQTGFSLTSVLTFLLRGLIVTASYFLVELFVFLLLPNSQPTVLIFGALWALLLSAVVLILPRLAGRIVFGISYFAIALWGLAQTGYYFFFSKLMWLSDMRYASEGADYADMVFSSFPALWWIAAVVLVVMGVMSTLLIPKGRRKIWGYVSAAAMVAASIVGICLTLELVFMQDNGVWGTHSDYARAASKQATYETMYDAKKVYDVCGVYQLTMRDLWKHEIYPLTPSYRQSLQQQAQQVDEYFNSRASHADNEMTGIFEGKNVILVLMETMDDFIITEEDTPTLCRLMDEGINFNHFYTPGFGSVRTFNTEFCSNTGMFLATNGSYAFDFITNSYDQSLASRLTAEGYNAQVFHYNDPSFYSRGVYSPAMGYETYNSYEDYAKTKDDLYNECFLFENEELSQRFFREGPTLNFIITRSAHMSYSYNEVVSDYALRQYPEYRGKFGDEEEDCIRAKARLVDDMFARLLEELEARGELENTVIVGITDHYAYSFLDTELMMELSGVDDEMLLEKTPCFIWAANGPDVEVSKTLNTSDLLPTVLNLMGIESAYHYLGRDAFDEAYTGWAVFPDGSWATEGIFYKQGVGILLNENGEDPPQEFIDDLTEDALEFIRIGNLLLTSDYYASDSAE